MATISVGDVIPVGTFKYVPYTVELDDQVCFLMIIELLVENDVFSWPVVSVSNQISKLF